MPIRESLDSVQGEVDDVQQGFVDAKEWTGFEKENELVPALEFVDGLGNRNINLTPKTPETDYSWYQSGIKYTKESDTFQISDVDGLHYVYYDEGTLTEYVGTDQETTDNIIRDKPLISIPYWSVTLQEFFGVGSDELHGKKMDGETHLYLHEKYGFQFVSGCNLTDIVSDGDGSLESSIEWGCEAGIGVDEDRSHIIVAKSTTDTVYTLYRDGIVGNWAWQENKYGLINDPTSGRVMWDNAGTLEVAPNRDYVLMHVAIGNNNDKKPFSIVGQAVYASRNDARDGIGTEVNSISGFGGFSAEFKILCSRIVQTRDAFTNGAKAIGISTGDTGSPDYYDFRENEGSKAQPINDHNNLINRDNPQAHEQYILQTDITHDFVYTDSKAYIQSILDLYENVNIGGTLTFNFGPGEYESGTLTCNIATVGKGEIIFQGTEQKSIYGRVFAHGYNDTLSLSGSILTTTLNMASYIGHKIYVVSDTGSGYSTLETTITDATSTTLTLAEVTGLIPANITKKGAAYTVAPLAKIPVIQLQKEAKFTLQFLDTGVATYGFLYPSQHYLYNNVLSILSISFSRSYGYYNTIVGEFSSADSNSLLEKIYIFSGGINISASSYCYINDMYFFGGRIRLLENSYMYVQSSKILDKISTSGSLVTVDSDSFFDLYSPFNSELTNTHSSPVGTGINVSENSFARVQSVITNFQYGTYSSQAGKMDRENSFFVGCTTDYSPTPLGTRGNEEGVTI